MSARPFWADLPEGDDRPLRVAMVVFPEFTLLDLVGPQTVFATTAEIHIVAETLAPVVGDTGLALLPTTTFADCPDDLDVLFVPGGGVAGAMRDARLLDFLRSRAPRARYVTAVCTGSLVLAAAGLLAGHRATTHWSAHDVLGRFTGVTAVRERVVVDGNRMTGGGVTAGIDFGLTLLATLRGAETAQLNQLLMEYDPAPPFDAGTPLTAPESVTGLARALLSPALDELEEAARESLRDLDAR